MKAIIFLFVLYFSPICLAQDQASDLNRVIASIKQIEKEISLKQQVLASPQAIGKEVELNKQIAALISQQKSLEHSLEEIASGVNLDLFEEDKVHQKISWENELQELVAPVLSQIKRATSRPREIEKLRSELGNAEELIAVSDLALSNLNELRSTSKDLPQVETMISTLEELWNQRKKSWEARTSILRQKLGQRLGEKKNLSQSLEEVFHLFFKSRGRNLLIAILSAFIFWICFKRIHKIIQSKTKSKKKSFNFRLFNMLFLLGSGIGTVAVFLLILFFTGDWLLLILSFFILTGIIWTSRDAISKFWGESLLLLNLGPVREGERVSFNGVPMRVASMSYNALLENPNLDGQAIKLPLKDLLGLRSRKSAEGESWYPSKTGDWILLDSSKLAMIEIQTIENIRLRFPGGSHCLINSSDYLSSRAINISSGFRISTTIGIDYSLLEKISSEILIKLEQEIKANISQTQYNQYLVNLRVEFEKPSSSTLDIAIITDFKGEIAKDYDILRRLMNKLAVDACNKNSWHLPFPQLDVHMKTGNL